MVRYQGVKPALFNQTIIAHSLVINVCMIVLQRTSFPEIFLSPGVETNTTQPGDAVCEFLA